MFILGIETSCDETGIAIYNSKLKLIFNKVYSQIELHKTFGGTVPEIASRNHSYKIFELLLLTLKEAKLKLSAISLVAYTKGPGLVGSVLIGATLAKSISFALKIPAIGINHLEAHININLYCNNDITYPFLSLVISGGHTFLVEKSGSCVNNLLGETKDDSIGETFDKIAKLLKFEYPNGFSIENASEIFARSKYSKLNLNFPIIDSTTFDFSFSGLKSHIFRFVKENEINYFTRNELSYKLQDFIFENIVSKCIFAVKQTGIKKIVVGGGVASNKFLRNKLFNSLSNLGIKVYFPDLEYCTDNGAMVAFNGFLKYKKNLFDKTFSINIFPRLPIT